MKKEWENAKSVWEVIKNSRIPLVLCWDAVEECKRYFNFELDDDMKENLAGFLYECWQNSSSFDMLALCGPISEFIDDDGNRENLDKIIRGEVRGSNPEYVKTQKEFENYYKVYWED